MSSKLYSENEIRAFVTTFYDEMVNDVMIGFFFRNADKERLIEKEIELISRMLGHSVRYTGKSLRKAHAPHPIMGGHFERRWVLLKNAMTVHQVPQDVQDLIEQHTRRLRSQITSQQGSDCNHDQVEHEPD